MPDVAKGHFVAIVERGGRWRYVDDISGSTHDGLEHWAKATLLDPASQWKCHLTINQHQHSHCCVCVSMCHKNTLLLLRDHTWRACMETAGSTYNNLAFVGDRPITIRHHFSLILPNPFMSTVGECRIQLCLLKSQRMQYPRVNMPMEDCIYMHSCQWCNF